MAKYNAERCSVQAPVKTSFPREPELTGTQQELVLWNPSVAQNSSSERETNRYTK